VVDLFIAVAIAGALLAGLWLGLARALPLAGFAAGAALGTRAPLLVGVDLDSPSALIAALPAALLLGALGAVLVESRAWRLGRLVRGSARADAGGGALLAAAAALVAVWALAPVAAQAPALRDPIQRSDVLARVNAIAAPAGPTRTKQPPPIDNLPRFAGAGPDIAPGSRSVLLDADVRAAERSVMRIEVLLCDGAATGSGWIGADGVVVTNAHVVAGSRAITAQARGRGPRLRAVPIWFDGEHDIALLRVEGLRGRRVLPMVRDAQSGTSAATLGFPLGRWAVRRARVGPTTDRIVGRLGGRPAPSVSNLITGRLVTTIRGRLQPGNSGGPVLDDRGRVLTTAFAGGFAARSLGVPNRFVRTGLLRAGPRVPTGGCR
jgi:S1-C subfamily serine protease